MNDFNEQENIALDRIINARRTTRVFSEKMPEKSDIEDIIAAGMNAPFASISAGDVDIFRRFYPLIRGHKYISVIHDLIKTQSQIDLDALNAETESNQFLKEHSRKLQGLWGMVAEKGIPGFTDIPYLVIAAEWAGARRAERQSLAHAMENMWLKATALNLGFCLVSPIESMSDNEEFCSLFDLPVGRYGFHGCLIGYPKNEPSATRNKVRGSVNWL